MKGRQDRMSIKVFNYKKHKENLQLRVKYVVHEVMYLPCMKLTKENLHVTYPSRH